MATQRNPAGRTGLRWRSAAACAWSVVFAAPHFYWAVGGRRGLGAEALAADEALQQPWFFAYNLFAGLLALAAVAAAVLLVRRAGRRDRTTRVLRAAAGVAGVLLFLRGVVGLAGLAADLARGQMDAPLVLVLIEPWFVLGGIVFVTLAHETPAAAAVRLHLLRVAGGKVT